MLISTKVSFDLLKLSHPAVINAMQGDKNTRSIEAKLYSDGYPLTDTSGLTAAVAFKKSDGTSGIYDRLPNGASAVTVSNDTITAILAPQMLTVPGKVNSAILLSDASQQNQISTFPFHVHVEANPAAEAAASDDYYNYTSWEELSNAADAWFAEQAAKVDEVLDGVSEAVAETNEARESIMKEANDAIAEIRQVATNGVDATAIVSSAQGEVITLNDSADRLLRGLKVFGKTEQNGTPTPDAPVPLKSVGDSVNVTVAGKNLLPKGKSAVSNGVTFTVNDDGSITADAPANVEGGAKAGYLYIRVSLTVGEKYIMSGVPAGASTTTHYILMQGYKDGALNFFGGGYDSKEYTFTMPDGVKNCDYAIGVMRESTAKKVTFYPMIRIASDTDSTYEPYKEVKTLSISTPNGLPGIPVESGGNYTDGTGNQWICDEVDFEKGVYVQRVDVLICNGSENWGLWTNSPIRRFGLEDNSRYQHNYSPNDGVRCLSDYFKGIPYNSKENDGCWLQQNYLVVTDANSRFADANAFNAWLAENPVTFMFPIATPKETPLSPEQLAAFAALHSNYPNTTVFNDKNAGMEVKYVADTKLYIDRKFNELAAALVSKV